MPIPDDLPPEQLRLILPVVEETLQVLRRAVAEMPVDTPPAVDYKAEG